MSNHNKNITIAIDGYSSCGKSTLAKDLAKKLGYIYVDSGAMYRAVTLYCIEHNIIQNGEINEKELNNSLSSISINFKYNNNKKRPETYLNNKNVEEKIRNIEVSENVSLISKLSFVRKKLVRIQQEMSKNKSIVMDGRDIGTVVFPDADFKIFLTANVEIRAQRRYDELKEKNTDITFKDIMENIEKRDYIDENRKISPLRKAKDAIVLDNSNLNKEEQLEWILKIIADSCV
ncbi:MAG: (d)CMP kinase [Bacteroidales bacterium]|nr:(d)CMP kinase [Bacteroidales bacterium]